MSEALEARAEIAKLARLLRTEPGELAYLERAPARDVRVLRERVTETLFDSDRDLLEGLAAASRHLPVQVVAYIGRHVFGPLLCARVAGLMEPRRGAEVARRLPPDFLAEVALEIDPRRVRDVVGRMDVGHVVAVAEVLAAREEHVAMGRFVAHLEDEALAACVEAIGDADLLRTAFVLEGKERLDRIARMLSEERLARIVAVAAEEDLWAEAVDLLDHLAKPRRRAVADLFARQEPALLDALLRAAHRQELWRSVLPLVRLTSPDLRDRFAAAKAIGDADVLAGIARTAAQDGLWEDLLPLVPLLPARSRKLLAELAPDELSVRQRRDILASARAHGLLDELGELRAALE